MFSTDSPFANTPQVKTSSDCSLTWRFDECVDALSARAIIEYEENGADVVLGPACSQRHKEIRSTLFKINFSGDPSRNNRCLFGLSHYPLGSSISIDTRRFTGISHYDEHFLQCTTVYLKSTCTIPFIFCRRARAVVTLAQKFQWTDLTFMFSAERDPLVGRCLPFNDALQVYCRILISDIMPNPQTVIEPLPDYNIVYYRQFRNLTIVNMRSHLKKAKDVSRSLNYLIRNCSDHLILQFSSFVLKAQTLDVISFLQLTKREWPMMSQFCSKLSMTDFSKH